MLLRLEVLSIGADSALLHNQTGTDTSSCLLLQHIEVSCCQSCTHIAMVCMLHRGILWDGTIRFTGCAEVLLPGSCLCCKLLTHHGPVWHSMLLRPPDTNAVRQRMNYETFQLECAVQASCFLTVSLYMHVLCGSLSVHCFVICMTFGCPLQCWKQARVLEWLDGRLLSLGD